MGSKRWKITLDGLEHAVAAEYGAWSGKVAITVDGVRVARSCSSLGGGVTARDFPFIVARHDCYVRATTNGFTCKHDLIVDGRSVETGAARGGQLPMPSWAWAFIVACGLMAKAGGLLGVPLGMGGAYACRRIARDQGGSAEMRAALCGAVTFACWSAYILLAIAVVGATGFFR